jgi:peptidoglycan/xylan/chitin deacetylase (PgdA/CDA1 family)
VNTHDVVSRNSHLSSIFAVPLILCYHKIEARRELGVTRLSPKRFARQIERFAGAGWRALSSEELLACVRGERAVAPLELVITFDDAYRGLREHAFPVLEALGWPSICFAITEYAGRLNRWDVAYGGRRFAHLSWRDMRRWEARGVTFGSHTARHPRLTWLDEAAVRLELEESRAALEGGCDRAAPLLSYPFGAAGKREARLAGESGYEGAVALARRRSGDRFDIPRLPVYLWSPPRPGIGVTSPAEWIVAAATNRCAIGTSAIQKLRRGMGGPFTKRDSRCAMRGQASS